MKLNRLQKTNVLDDEKSDKQIQEVVDVMNKNLSVLEEQESIIKQSIAKKSKSDIFYIGKDSTGNPEVAMKIEGKNYKFTIIEIT